MVSLYRDNKKIHPSACKGGLHNCFRIRYNSSMGRFFLAMMILSFLPWFPGGVLAGQGDAKPEKTPVEALFKDPEAYKGKRVVLGGVILGFKAAQRGMYIETLQRPLDEQERPVDTDLSYGRFIVLHEGLFDKEIFYEGREVTVIGEVLGRRSMQEEGEPHLLIRCEKIYLY